MGSKVTAIVSTKGRYFTTLPHLLISVAMQTVKPEKLIIYDDGEHRDLRNEALYQNIFLLLSQKGIAWEVAFGNRIGQVANHQRSIEDAKTDWIWRLDDDNVVEHDTLEKLLSCVAENVGAVGGLVLDPKFNYMHLNTLASNKIEDIYLGLNIQWYKWTGIKEVDHLYSTFIYRKAAARQIGGYSTDLSRVGHREETIFTYSMKRAGWALLVNADAVTWHMRAPQGGIRSDSSRDMWMHDEEIFRKHLVEWGVTPRNMKLVVLDNGIGDHLIFAKVLPDLKKKYSNVVLSVCYPELFADDKDVTLISIADAQQMMDITPLNVYKYLWDNQNRKMNLETAYREIYGV